MILLQVANEEFVNKGFELFDKLTARFFIRLGIDLLAAFVLVRLIYFRRYKSSENFFTFFIFNIIIFMITFILNKSDMSMGAAFGLFAVFSMLRYRTEGISTKDMTYLFLSIAIGLITALSKGTWFELLLINFIILFFTYLLESSFLIKKEETKIIQYENIEMIQPEFRAELLADLEKRMGLKIHRIAIGKIDFLKDTAIIKVFYYEAI